MSVDSREYVLAETAPNTSGPTYRRCLGQADNGKWYWAHSLDVSTNGIEIYSSDDPSAGAWTLEDNTLGPSGALIRAVHAVIEGNTIHVFGFGNVSVDMGTTTFDVFHRRFDCSTDTWAAAAVTAVTSTSAGDGHDMPRATWRDSDSTLILVTQDGADKVMGTDYNRIGYCTWTSGGGWTSITRLSDGAAEAHHLRADCVCHPVTDRTHFMWEVVNGVQTRSLSSADSLDTTQETSTTAQLRNPWNRIAYTYSSNDYVLFVRAANGGLPYSLRLTSSTNQTPNEVATNTITPSTASHGMGLAWNVTDAELYVYAEDVDTIVRSTSTDGGGTWGTKDTEVWDRAVTLTSCSMQRMEWEVGTTFDDGGHRQVPIVLLESSTGDHYWGGDSVNVLAAGSDPLPPSIDRHRRQLARPPSGGFR